MQNTLEQEMYRYFTQLDEVQKKSVILMLKSFLLGKNKIGEIDIIAYNKEIEEAIARVEAGNFIIHEEVVRQSKEW